MRNRLIRIQNSIQILKFLNINRGPSRKRKFSDENKENKSAFSTITYKLYLFYSLFLFSVEH